MKQFRYNGVTGHRGNPVEAPENTLESFENAIKLGCDFIETDICRSLDGRFMLCHDQDALRTCGIASLIEETSSIELRKLDASFGFNQENDKSYPVTRIPFLEEALELLEKYPDMRLSLQPKCPWVKEICDVVKKHTTIEQLAFNDGNLSYLKTIKEQIPEALVFFDIHRAEQLDKAIAVSLELEFFGIVAHKSALSQKAVDAIIAAGLEPGVWTVNCPNEIRDFLNLGVVRFYSDFPAEVLRQKQNNN